MKKNRAISLLLSMALVLGLCACGGGGEGNTGKLSGTVYVPTYQDIDAGKLGLSYIYSGCSDGTNLYVLGETEEEKEITDEETGETYYSYTSSSNIYKVPLEGGALEPLANYTAPVAENEDSWAGVQGIRMGEDGTLWVQENKSTAVFDLPDGFDENTDDKWNYGRSEDTVTMRQIDSTGAEIQRVDIQGLAQKLELEYANTPALDASGNVYVTSDKKLYVLDSGLNKLFELEALEGENLYNTPIQLGDGSMGLVVDYSKENAETGESTWGLKMKTIDFAKKAWGPEYALPRNAYTALPGGGDYLFYFENGDSMYGYDAAKGEGRQIFSWIDSDINKSEVQFYTFLDDGRVVALIQEYKPRALYGTASAISDSAVLSGTASATSDSAASAEAEDENVYTLAILTATDASTLPEKTTLTYATMGLGYDARSRIIAFNRSSDKYRIEVSDYSEYNTGEDTSAGLTKLTTEIGAGRVPDIIRTGNQIPVRLFASRGVLEDLWPFIENDPDLGRDAVMEHVLEASEVDGKLVEIFSNFTIRTAAGNESLVGDKMSWTIQDLKDALAQMPEGCAIFGEGNTKEGMLNGVLAMNMDNFVDWNTGKCSFDSDNFKALLEFCNTFPDQSIYDDPNFNWNDYVYESEGQRILNGKQLLVDSYLYDFGDMVRYDAYFPDSKASFVGYPMEDGSVGSSFSADPGLAMSSTCKDKDGAWEFMRETLLPSKTDTEGAWWNGIPVNKADFDKGVEYALTEEYELDENGEQMLDENGEPVKRIKYSAWINDENQFEFPCVTQEQADRFLALYNAVDRMYEYDESIYKIVREQAGAYFAGDRDVDSTAQMIQSRVDLYVNEQK